LVVHLHHTSARVQARCAMSDTPARRATVADAMDRLTDRMDGRFVLRYR
jgi:hypothetical protein